MGLYIPNMQMPTGGRILIVFPSGRVLEVSADATQDIFRETQAFPVPPHGRLGDLDALEKVMSEGIAPSVKDGGFKHPFDIIRAVANAPTIIPADPAEEGET